VSWDDYASAGFWDELMTSEGPRESSAAVVSYLSTLSTAELRERQEAADLAIRTMGITFTVHSEAGNIDRSWPFDIIPRVISTQEWARVSIGLIQRLTALNLFVDDLYSEARVLKDGIIPAEVIHGSPNFRRECLDARPPLGVWAHICGSDLVRDKDGTLYVLEDNLRVPSGVSYMLENRLVTKRVFTEAFRDLDILPVDSYPNRLFELLASLSRGQSESPMVVVLTPGIYNSAYFEHSYLAQQMGVPLVEGADLVVESDDCVYLKTIAGLRQVDVIYRRVDDLFLDPEVFRPDSSLGVPGLMRAWHAGTVAIANAPGAGVADDKVVYAFVPALIQYYLGEDSLLANVPTFLCHDDVQRSHVLANLDNLVVKPANESGGYGVFVGSHATAAEKDELRRRVIADPRGWIAQPILSLSTCPTLCGGRIEPRHLDLRPFILSGERPYVTQGGLTRVALQRGSLVVNSSQGGGSKDTWVLDPTFVPL
jgi:uncharacterized circularly permuted ATP-grasp superfamily protein